MGAWSHEAFVNDDAGDWIAQLQEQNDLSLVEPSELMELWDESEDAAAWRASVGDLKARLG